MTFRDTLEIAVAGVTVSAAVWAATVFVFRPLLDSLIQKSLARCREVDEARIRTYFVEDIRKREEYFAITGAHTDQITTLEAAMMAQGRELMGKVENAARELTKTLSSMEHTLEKIANDCNDNTKQTARLTGLWHGRFGDTGIQP